MVPFAYGGWGGWERVGRLAAQGGAESQSHSGTND